MTQFKKITLNMDLATNADRDWLADFISDTLSEMDIDSECFSYSIEIAVAKNKEKPE